MSGKYRHRFHAGNFADVHKHVTLLALLRALARKEKGFAYLDTHAGRGAYDLEASVDHRATRQAFESLLAAPPAQPEIADFAQLVSAWRARAAAPHGYPGSPLIACAVLRPQDRAVLIELAREEARALETALPQGARARVECDDGFERLRAHLPPPERRGLTLIDPPYEQPTENARAQAAAFEAVRRFPTGVLALWYPIKDERDTRAWLGTLTGRLGRETLVSELALHPCDSRVALNGSGLLIANPPYRFAEAMRRWLPELHARLCPAGTGGCRVELAAGILAS